MRRTCLILSLLLTQPAIAQQAADAVEPEAATDGRFEAETWMVAAANPHAVRAGAEVLRAGGTAADAFVAVQTVLGLVEPRSSGVGGGAFLVWHDSASGELTTLDARETAPLAATPRRLQTGDGKPLDVFDAVAGGRSVGVPRREGIALGE